MTGSDKFDNVLRNMILFDIAFLAFGEIIIFAFLPDKSYYALGFFAGVFLAVVSSVLIKMTLSWSIHRSGKTAAIISVMSYLLRLSVIGIVIVSLYYTKAGDAIAAFVGLLSLKLSAYIAPLRQKK